MFKFGTIGAFKQVRNNPRCKATAKLQNGMVVIPNDATGKAPVPANATEAQGKVWVVYNIIDKPETRDAKEFVIESGEYVRAFYLEDLKEMPVELDYRVLVDDYSTLSVGDVLVPAGDGSGKWVKADGETIVAADYDINLLVLEKTTFGDKGLYCKVIA